VSNSAQCESAAATPVHWLSSPTTLLQRAAELARKWRERRRQRAELFEYIALDHRAAGDIGITGYEARNWAERPFWRD
jgi:uncharacterized protein YjiS (DUF1127 family)